MRTSTEAVLPSSFRDPSGFLFRDNGILYRQINRVYQSQYEHLIRSGLYRALICDNLLVAHQEVPTEIAPVPQLNPYIVIRPEPIPFISYPYEWSFSQLKACALLTLQVQKRALDYGMTLKDASAYNIQFKAGKPILIDTLSFDRYQEGEPWAAYRQFCRHFLAPLALMAYKDLRLNQLFRLYIDGLPLDLTSSLLPLSTYFRISILSHLHLHARAQQVWSDPATTRRRVRMSRRALLGLIESLETGIHRLRPPANPSIWSQYYEDHTYSREAFSHKLALVEAFLEITQPQTVWDMGANTGRVSQLAARKGSLVIAFDADPLCVELTYRTCVERGEARILPLYLDLTNPSPSLGWAHQERLSLAERGPVDMLLALALIHHLALANNVPLEKIAQFFHGLCRMLVIEFVPKQDAQVQRLLAVRTDIFPEYTQGTFEQVFERYFLIERIARIRGTERTLYLMRAK
ncbi:MAG: SAM-dependent methyltransferase [Nitrospirae bacterium]|nr:MAG: SAM-dependent methyltransferase [Nitrospirota bacterium]